MTPKPADTEKAATPAGKPATMFGFESVLARVRDFEELSEARANAADVAEVHLSPRLASPRV